MPCCLFGWQRYGTQNGEAMPASLQPPQSDEPQSRSWLAAYTRSRHEQQVALQLKQKNLECLLPTYERRSRWSDRVKRARAPLFPGYVFVQVADCERRRVLETAGVVNLVSRAGRVVQLSETEVV